MEKLKQHKSAVAASLVFLMLALFFIGVYLQNRPPQTLYPQEIRDYEGQNLSSISDFRENSIKGPQQVNNATYRLRITGLVNKTLEYTYDEIISKFQKYQKVVTLYCVEGWQVTILWEGFLVKDLLQEAGIDNKTQVVIFYAYDGYSTSLPLDYLMSKDILIAYKMNGLVLPSERGFPFQLVAESKYGYKWIKWIPQIGLPADAASGGLGESRAFSNNATVPNTSP